MVTTRRSFEDTVTSSEEVGEKKVKDKVLTEFRKKVLDSVKEKPTLREDLCQKFDKAMGTMFAHLVVLEKAKYVKRVKLRCGEKGRPCVYWVDYAFNVDSLKKGTTEEKLIHALSDGLEHNVKEISQKTGIKSTVVSNYLKYLSNDRIVSKSRKRKSKSNAWSVR